MARTEIGFKNNDLTKGNEEGEQRVTCLESGSMPRQAPALPRSSFKDISDPGLLNPISASSLDMLDMMLFIYEHRLPFVLSSDITQLVDLYSCTLSFFISVQQVLQSLDIQRSASHDRQCANSRTTEP